MEDKETTICNVNDTKHVIKLLQLSQFHLCKNVDFHSSFYKPLKTCRMDNKTKTKLYQLLTKYKMIRVFHSQV